MDDNNGCVKAIFIAAAIATILGLVVAVIGLAEHSSQASGVGSQSSTGQQASSSGTSSQSGNPTQLPVASQSTSAPPAPGTELYQANWSSGANGWTGTADWKVLNGMLLDDGSNSDQADQPTIVAPFRPSTANYVIEAQIQVTSYPGSTTLFGLVGRAAPASDGSSSWQGYEGDISGYLDADGNNNSAHIIVFGYDNLGPGQGVAFEPGSGWHTYRLEVRGNSIRFLIDGNPLVQTTDNHYLQSGQVGLRDFGVQLQVRSFSVTAL